MSAMRYGRNWEFDWLTSWDEIWDPTFIAQWQAWMDRSADAHVFFEPPFVRAWCETYPDPDAIKPRFLIGRQGSERSVFLPLVCDSGGWRDMWLRVMRPVGFDVFDYHDPVFDFSCLKDVRETFWLALKDELNRRRKEFDYVSIPRIREQFAANSEDFKQTDKAPYMDLSRFASFEELVSALPKLWRRDIRCQQRRLSKLAPLELRVCGEEDVEYAVKQFLPAFLKAHRARWPEAYQPAALYERLIVDGLAEGTVHLSTLASGDIPFSWGLRFLHKNRFYYYKGAWDADMAKFSPKKVHVARLLDRLISEHVEVFDFLPGQEPYKFQWTQTSTELFRHRYRMPGLQAGARYWWQMNLRPRVSRAKRFFAGTPASGGQA